MTDRELLERAALAAGIVILRSRLDDPLAKDMLAANSSRNVYHENGPWSPLTDDGDALRLAVKLDLNVLPGIARAPDGNLTLDGTEDIYAATRRAIVRAAAAMAPGEAP